MFPTPEETQSAIGGPVGSPLGLISGGGGYARARSDVEPLVNRLKRFGSKERNHEYN